MHKAFITYHHDNDQSAKEALLDLNARHSIFIDKSVHTGDIPDRLDDEAIRRIIRDDYLRDSTVTILLVGKETKGRKHVDWEVYSSMFDGTVNTKSGILVINLPSTGCSHCTTGHGTQEQSRIYPEISIWTTIDTRSEYERRYPHMPARIVDNLLAPNVRISVVPWTKAMNADHLSFLLEATYANRKRCTYDLHRKLRRHNSP